MTLPPAAPHAAPHADAPSACVVDIGGSFMKFGLAAASGTVRQIDQVPTPSHSWDDFQSTLARLVAPWPGCKLAVSTAGLVDPETGEVTATNIPCLAGRHLAGTLAAALHRQVLVANDADCFALAEAHEGAGRGHAVVFGIILGTGVGGGLVVHGRLVPGVGGVSGEWGHGPVAATSAGTPPVAIPRFACGCGQTGCIETVGGARGLERLHRHLHGVAQDSRPIVAAWQDRQPQALRTIEIWLELVAAPLALLVNATGAGIVPVGGGLGTVPSLVAALDEAVRRLILRRSAPGLLVPAALGADAGLVGAAVLARTEQ